MSKILDQNTYSIPIQNSNRTILHVYQGLHNTLHNVAADFIICQFKIQ